MEPDEYGSHSFVVKIWLEETVQEAGRAVWRGHITHVPSGKRRYFGQLGEVAVFIRPYLAEMGVRQGLRAWWQRLRGL